MVFPTLSALSRMIRRRARVGRAGFRRYDGDPVEICRDIVDDCWTGTHFKTSNGHFQDFYVRDFSFCAAALLQMKEKERVTATLKYSVECFKRKGKVTTTISPQGEPYDVPHEAADSLPLLIHSIKLASPKLLLENEAFFLGQVRDYYNHLFDPTTNLITAGRHFSSIKDLALRSSSTYDNCMVAMLQRDLHDLGFFNPFKGHDIKAAIMQTFWNGQYFYEDAAQKPIVTGDANVFPFWTGLVDDRKMFASCLRKMQEAKLDAPFPLKYTSEKSAISPMVWWEPLSFGYERDAVWMHLGLCFLDVVEKYHEFFFKEYLKRYTALIKQHNTFLEVYSPSGKPFSTPFYITDEAMLWCVKYVAMARKHRLL